MAELFQRAAIVGLGLVGGSLAMVLRKKRLVRQVIAIDTDERVLAKAVHRNVVDQAVADATQGLSQARLVVLAVPDHLTPDVLSSIAGHIEPGAVVCDVGRIKGPVLARAAEVLPESVPFVGCHPVVLKEGKDLDEAYPALFQNRPCILTPGNPRNEEAVRQLKGIWEEAGCRVEEMDPERHDRLFSVLDDLPIVLLQLICRAAGQLSAYVDDLDLYSGRELKEITKLVAKAPPQVLERLWANRQPLLHVLTYYRLKLKEVAEALQGEDPQALEALLMPRR
jgi:prephenate dehydrogenase